MVLDELWKFLKNPVYQIDSNTSIKYKVFFLLKLLVLSLTVNIALSIIIGGVLSSLDLELGKHAIETLFNNYSYTFILFAAVILAPILEELLFRGPMFFFRKSSNFRFFFYLFTLAFGFYHIINYEITPAILALSPLLVAPQILVGAFMGFIRIRLGLVWAMLLHASYNLVLVGSVILLKASEISLE